jgi:hypothetical protein
MLTDELRDRLLEIARKAAIDRGWPWSEPVDVRLSQAAPRRVWLVHSDYLSRGSNVIVLIREDDLAVLDATFLPR